MELGLNLKHFLLQLPHFIGAERWWLWGDRRDERQASCCFHGTSGSQSCCPSELLTHTHFWSLPGPIKIESLQVEPRLRCYLRAPRWRWCAAKVEGQSTTPHCLNSGPQINHPGHLWAECCLRACPTGCHALSLSTVGTYLRGLLHRTLTP